MALTYTHMYSGDDGLTYFKDVELEATPGRPWNKSSAPTPATGVFLRESEGVYDNEWHTAPRTTWCVVLEGGLEIVASGGETRVFKAGDVFLQDDPTGKGHYTKALNGEPRKMLFVTVD